MNADAIKRFFERLFHCSYMINILNLLGIAPITEETICQNVTVLTLAGFPPILRRGLFNTINSTIKAKYVLKRPLTKIIYSIKIKYFSQH